jgi:hypothetical protein
MSGAELVAYLVRDLVVKFWAELDTESGPGNLAKKNVRLPLG